MDNNKEVKVVFTLTNDHVLLPALAAVADKAKRFRGESFSEEYWAEQLLARGIKTYDDYLDNDHDRRNREAYVKASAMLKTPAPTGDAVKDAKAALAYMAENDRLKQKYGIGGTAKQV